MARQRTGTPLRARLRARGFEQGRQALGFALELRGRRSRAARTLTPAVAMAMIATTTSSSISVKPR